MSEFKATIKQRSSSNHHHHHHHKESKNYNVVTKAMSKYMPQTSYEQNCISKSLNHHQSTTTHDNRLLLNGNNTLRQKYLINTIYQTVKLKSQELMKYINYHRLNRLVILISFI